MGDFFERKTGLTASGKIREGSRRRRLATQAAHMSLPKPTHRALDLEFDPDRAILRLGGHDVRIDRTEDGGYQRAFEDFRARDYGANFNWGLFGTPLLSLRDDGNFWIVSGQHRLASAGYAGLANIEVAVYEGLTLEQEAWLFNQEATQRRDLTALDKFHSGVRAGLPDHVAVAAIVQSVGGNIPAKSSPRIGNVQGITAVSALLTTYDLGGASLLKETLTMVRSAFGSLTGSAVNGTLLNALAMFLGIYQEGSRHGSADRKKMLKKLQAVTPDKLKKDASSYENQGQVPARFQALVDLYNWKTQNDHRLDYTRPDWRKVQSPFCTAPGCTTGPKMSPGKSYRRGLCKRHYMLVKSGSDLISGLRPQTRRREQIPA